MKTAVTTPVAPIDQLEIGFVPFKALVGAIAAWETMHRAGELRPAAEVAALPIDQVANESATLLWHLLGQHGASAYWRAPAIGEYWPGQGGVYAGQVREEDGTTYHEILADEKPPTLLTHDGALAWASGLSADGWTDFTLPTRSGGALLFANLRDRFEPRAHWLAPQYSRNFAWSQLFAGGYQLINYKSAELRARAVRRFIP